MVGALVAASRRRRRDQPGDAPGRSQGGHSDRILFTAALALGVALISSIRTYAVDLSHILFGNVLGVSQATCG